MWRPFQPYNKLSVTSAHQTLRAADRKQGRNQPTQQEYLREKCRHTCGYQKCHFTHPPQSLVVIWLITYVTWVGGVKI